VVLGGKWRGEVDQQRVFLSAVTREFGSARDRLANRLHGARIGVMVQREFLQSGGALTLLRKLHDHIKDCATVVCLIGTRAGHSPTEIEAAELSAELPGILPAGIDRASYTQWEFFLGRHYRRRMLNYRATDKFERDTTADADPAQAAFLTWLEQHGIDLTPVDSAGDFQAEAMAALQGFDGGPKPVHPDIHSIGELFTGRDAFLDRLRASLLRQNGGVSAIRALHGLGGIGKTRAAMEYALRHRDDYTALLFVRAYDEATLDRELAALTGVLRLPEQTAADDTVRKDAVLRWLASHPGWLLILDNVDTPEALRAASALARSLRSGHVLLTSRLEGSFAQDIETLELGLLTPEDAVAYLLKATEGRRRPEPDAAAQAGVLAEALDHLTLALVHAGAYIAERRFTFARYLAEWHGNRARVLDWAAPDVTGYPLSLAQTWITSMDQLTPAGRALLERLSFFANDPVPEFLLDVPLPGVETAEGLEPLLNLQRFSLITRIPEFDRFVVHRIVRDVTSRRLATDPGGPKARLVEALGWIDADHEQERIDLETIFQSDPLLPHAEAVAWAADRAGILNPTAQVMSDVALFLGYRAQFDRAEPLMRRALAIEETCLGPDHSSVATRLVNLAELLVATNRRTAAEPLMRRALAIDETTFGPDHPNVARDLRPLCLLLYSSNRQSEAEPLIRRALAIDQANGGSDSTNVGLDLFTLAVILKATNRLAEAEPLMRNALAIEDRRLGTGRVLVGYYLNELSSLLLDANRFIEAEPLIRRAIAIGEAMFGPDHPSVAGHINNLSLLLSRTNRMAEAEPLIRRALAIDEACFGPDHPKPSAPLQQPRPTAPGHQPFGGRGAIDAPHPGHR